MHSPSVDTVGRPPTPRAAPPVSAGAVFAGIVAPVVFVTAFSVAGALRPGYSPVRTSISRLGVGAGGSLESGAAILTGVLVVVFVMAFMRSMRAVMAPATRRMSGVLLALPGVGLALSGVFTAARPTVTIHAAVSSLGIFGGIVAFFVAGRGLRRDPRWRRWSAYSRLTGLVTLILTLIQFLVANPHAPLATWPIGGLVERLLVIVMLAWYAAFGWRLLSIGAAAGARASASPGAPAPRGNPDDEDPVGT